MMVENDILLDAALMLGKVRGVIMVHSMVGAQ